MKSEVRIFKQHQPEYQQAVQLRYKILRKPLGLQFTAEELKKDEADMHFGLFTKEEILACLTLTISENKRVKMRQVAVDDSVQQQGLGRQLSLAAEQYARQNGFTCMYCNARKTAVPFYERLGYKIVSGEFEEVGIPHYTMEKAL